MIGGDVQDYGDIRREGMDSIQLKTAYLQYKIVRPLLARGIGYERRSDITPTNTLNRHFKHTAQKGGDSGLSIGAGYRNYGGINKTAGQL